MVNGKQNIEGMKQGETSKEGGKDGKRQREMERWKCDGGKGMKEHERGIEGKVKKAGRKGRERRKGKEGKGKGKRLSDRGERKGGKGEEGKMAMEKKIG